MPSSTHVAAIQCGGSHGHELTDQGQVVWVAAEAAACQGRQSPATIGSTHTRLQVGTCLIPSSSGQPVNAQPVITAGLPSILYCEGRALCNWLLNAVRLLCSCLIRLFLIHQGRLEKSR